MENLEPNPSSFKLTDLPQQTFNREMQDCLQILAGSNLDYWLDYGTLLGAYRDGRFIEWDNDIDFGMFPSGVNRITGLEKDFRRAGFQMNVISYRGKVHQVHLYRQNPSINLNVYHDGGDHYWSLWLIPNSRLARLNTRVLHRRRLFHRAWTGLVRLGRAVIPKHVISWFFRDRIVTVQVPKSFFDARNLMTFQGTAFSVPAETEAYLEFRYGREWRVPHRDWTYWRDDGAVHKDAARGALATS